MASRRTKISSVASVAFLGAGGFFLYSVFAVQGQGNLAQAPLNVQIQIPPAFIMGVDNSGSMTTDELLFKTRQGNGYWNAARMSFFDAAGLPNESGVGYQKALDSGVPRPDMFGAARSPQYNRAYFNPSIVYRPWLTDTGVPEANSPPDAAPRDVRVNGGRSNFTVAEQETYTFPIGSRLSAGTEYYADRVCNQEGRAVNEWRTLSADLVFSSSCQTRFRFYRAVVYLADSEPAPAGYDLTKRIRVVGAGPLGSDLWRYDYVAENFTSGGADAVQNFANWWTYYGNRNRAMIAAMTQSMSDINNVRVGYFQINPPYPNSNVYMHDMSIPGDRTLLYQKMRNLNASGSTPSRRATRYLGEQFMRTDSGAPVRLACQKNGGMLFTDGFTNDDALSGSRRVGNADAGMGAPFADNRSDTIADLAAWMYNTNLRPDLPAGRVPVPAACSSPNPDPRLDCQANLHVNFYGVTLGARGAIYDVDAAATDDPYANPPAWSATGSMNLDPANVDDIWHAALNSRGEFINAQTPNDITAAIRRVLASVSAGASPAGSLALTGARIGAGSLSVVPFYEARNDGTDWYSTLTAQTVSVSSSTGVVGFNTAWEASARLPSASVRNDVFFGRGNAAPLRFESANVGDLARLCDNPVPGMSLCTSAQISALGGGTTLDEAISYLKGDNSHELERNPSGKLRYRTTALGDIVNSTPVVSAPSDDYGYRNLPSPYGGASYNSYLATKSTRRAMVYAGANDGMLHGFDGRVGSSGGVERFAFIPQSVMGHMGNLLFPYQASNAGNQRFKHRYFVDGPLVVSDTYYGGGWKTTLVGSTGAGARGVFALNVSGVSGISGNFNPADRLWEISDLNTGLTSAERNNIGYVLGKAVVVPIKTGNANGPVKWRAIFGNGYNSVSGKAVLYLVDIGTGSPNITMIEAVEASAPPGANGLGNIVVADRWGPAPDLSLTARSRDGFADTVYAADQKGAIWKFDLRSATPTNQTTPLFTTLRYSSGPESGSRQPILGGLTLASGPGGGVMLYFGTGSFSFDNDPVDNTQQSLYAVLDSVNGAPVTTRTRATMLQQTVSSTASGIRTTSSNAMPGGRTGWYLDLPSGERFVGYPRIESGILFMPTYAPNSATECTTSGVNWLYGLNALSGAAGLSNVRFDSPTGTSPGTGTGAVALDTQGTAPVKDVAVFTAPRVPPLAAGATPGELSDALAAQCSMVIQVAGAPPLYLPRACGRQSWRQLQ